MSRTKFLISLVLAVSVLVGQVGGVLAAPGLQDSTPITGLLQSIAVETDPSTGITTIVIEVVGTNQSTPQVVRLSPKTAEKLGLVVPDGDGNPVINNSALGRSIEIKRSMLIPAQEVDRHPIGNALEALFSDIKGVDYSVIMDAHNQEPGVGFGVIAQALWLTRQVHGDAGTFNALLYAKQNNKYDQLPFVILGENNTPIIPRNWGELRKAVSDGKKISKVASNQNSDNNLDNPNKGKGQNKDKSNQANDKSNAGGHKGDPGNKGK